VDSSLMALLDLPLATARAIQSSPPLDHHENHLI
jgi:hypothetical protein